MTSRDHFDWCAVWWSTADPTTASDPSGPEASALGLAVSAPGRKAGLHVRPLSVLTERGEKRKSWLGKKPTATESVPTPGAATIPPLSATPCGVTDDHFDEPGAACSNCQNVLT